MFTYKTIESKHNFDEKMNLINELKANQKLVRKTYLLSINKQLDTTRANNNGRIPYDLIPAIIKESKAIMPWLTRSIINKSFINFITNKQISV